MSDPLGNKPEDFLNKALKISVGALPVVGGALAELFNFAVADPAQERRDDFLRETMARLVALQSSHEQLSAEALRDNEQFQATMLQAARLATSTASEEKRLLLQNAVLNSAIIRVDENLRQIFLQTIESMTPFHVTLLDFLDNPKANPAAVKSAKDTYMGSMSHVIAAALPKVASDEELFRKLVGDLYRSGLTNRDSFSGVQSGGDSLLSRATTKLGRGLLLFIRAPE